MQKHFHRITFVLLAVLVVYAAVRFGRPVFLGERPFPTDFSVDWRAAERLFAGENIYRPDDSSPFKYSPAFAYGFAHTFYQLGKPLGWLVWCVLSVALWAFALAQFFVRTGRKSFLAFALALIASWHGFLEHLSYGQADFLVAALVFIATFQVMTIEERGKRSAPRLLFAALCLAVAALTKPASVLLMAPLAWWGLQGTGAAALALIGGGVLGVLALLPIDFALMQQWAASLSEQPAILFSGNLNQALGACLARTLMHPEWSETLCRKLFLGGAILFALLFFQGLNRRGKHKITNEERMNHLMIGVGLFLTVNPLSWRWSTFLWWPLGYWVLAHFRAADHSSRKPWLVYRTLCVTFLAIATLLQAVVAHALGIPEVDVLSYWGLYGWGSLILMTAVIVSTLETRTTYRVKVPSTSSRRTRKLS